MKKIKPVVFDTSVAVKWFFPEKGGEKALGLKNDHLKRKISLCTRDLFLYELTSAFRNYSGVKVEEKDFLLSVLAIQSLKLTFFPLTFEEMEELFLISRKLDVSIYDCSYILLAKRLKAPLYTADKKLYQKAHGFIASFFI